MTAIVTMAQLERISKGKFTNVNRTNAQSVLVALDRYGSKPAIGLNLKHRIIHYLAQLYHESGAFRYDKEIWGNTPAQKKYDTRTDLGNTPEVDGDGKLYMGRSGMQLTGKANYMAFTKWAREVIDPAAPDFVKQPDLINTDPWEGLVPIWYWTIGNPTRKSLNKYADINDIEMITRRINGGLNGFSDRLSYYTRVGLVLLGFEPTGIEAFQTAAKQRGYYKGEVDGDDGPQTRAAIHQWAALGDKEVIESNPNITIAKSPVTATKEVAVAPPEAEKPGKDIGTVVTAVVAGGGAQYVEPVLGTFGGLTPWIQAFLIIVALAAVAYFVWGRTLLAERTKAAKVRIEEKADAGLPT
jgi:putative chitinase